MTDTCPLCAEFDEPANRVTISKYNDPGKIFDHGAHVTATVTCDRCGDFRILLGKYVANAGKDTLLRLSGLTRIATNTGQETLSLTDKNLADVAASAPVPRTMGAYYDRLVQLIANRCRYPGEETGLFRLVELAAEMFLPTKACHAILRQSDSLIQLFGNGLDQLRMRCALTPQGWQRVDELTRQAPRSDRAFVAMWFDPQMTTVYEHGFQAALQQCGYEPPFRVDDAQHQEKADDPDFKNRIDDRILVEIRRARFVIADATGARPSVYYEAGFADGLGIHVIWTCREDWIDRMSFDTRNNEHILWRDQADLKSQLAAKIERRGWKRR